MELGIRSSVPKLLQQAIATARQIADQYRAFAPAGIAFLGAIVRGYFDAEADIDIALFTRGDPGEQKPPMVQTIDGFQIHTWSSDYAEAVSEPWPMHKRWAYSECQVYYDPEGRLGGLLRQKVPLGPQERIEMLKSGAALSEWYINRLTAAWTKRGSLLSAHNMFGEGMNHFFDMLFALNQRLVPADKWKIHYAQRLPLLPKQFAASIERVLTVRDFSKDELQRRVKAFMEMWEELLPYVEKVVGRSYQDFKDTV